MCEKGTLPLFLGDLVTYPGDLVYIQDNMGDLT